MKVLFLSQGNEVCDQPDYHASFSHAKSGGDRVEVLNIPFKGYMAKHGEESFYQEVLSQNENFQPDLVFFQFYHSGGDMGIAKCCHDLKASQNRPLIFGSLGDLFYTGWRRYFARPVPRSIRDLAHEADAFFSTSMGNVADELVHYGVKNLIFLPNAFCPEHFPYWEDFNPAERDYDIVMLCSKGKLINRRPVIAWQNNVRRRFVVNLLARNFASRFRVFGRGWGSDKCVGFVPFKDQVRIYRRSRVVVDAPAPTLGTTYYSSDRAFFMLGSGTPMVHFHTPRFEKMVRSDEHAYFVYKLRDVCSVCNKILSLPKDVLDNQSALTRQFVKERHLIDNRVDTILSVAEALIKVRKGVLSKDEALRTIRMWHFLPEVSLEEEYVHCVRNWVG